MATARDDLYKANSGDNIYGGITPKVAHVFMSTGQSNCQGRGLIADSPVADSVLIGNVKTWRRNINGGTMYSGVGAWYGLEYDTNQYEGRGEFGSILKFAMNAQAELENENNDLFFIQADGNGKPIEGWVAGNEYNAMYDGHIIPALSSLKEMDYDEIRIHSFVWNQGESDMLDVYKATAYKGRLETVISDLRAELDLPDLLFIIKRVEATPERYVWASRVVTAQEEVALEDDNTELVVGPWVYSDEVHLVGSSLNQLGNDLYTTTRSNTRGLIYA
jgi:hypothetical protein